MAYKLDSVDSVDPAAELETVPFAEDFPGPGRSARTRAQDAGNDERLLLRGGGAGRP
jgi:hypothetical protein